MKNPVDQAGCVGCVSLILTSSYLSTEEPCMNQQQLDIPDTGCDKAACVGACLDLARTSKLPGPREAGGYSS